MLDFGKKRDLKYVSYSKHQKHPATRERQNRLKGGARPVDVSYSGLRRLMVILVVLIVVGVGGAALALAFKSYDVVSSIIVDNSRSGELPIISAVGRDSLPILNWEQKKERINILFLGLDKRSWEKAEYSRTDTVILVSINPSDKSVIMVSVPRDLEISYDDGAGFVQYSRINAVHVSERDAEDKGAAPSAVKSVVSQVLGIPVHYFVRIDFQGFESLIDEFGGVTVDVEYPVYDDQYPDDAYGYEKVRIDAGQQVMDGETALQYVRSRHAYNANQQGDLNRAARQQQVAVALKEKMIATKWSLVSDPVKLSNLLNTLKENVLTDIQIDEMMELAKLAKEIDTNNPRKVISKVLADPYIYHDPNRSTAWQYYPRDPTYQEIHNYIAELLADPFILEDMALEGAAIRVENGTAESGVANDLTYELRTSYELNMLRAVSSDRDDYQSTVMYDISNGAYPRTVEFMERYLNITAFVPDEIEAGENADIVIIVGQDYLQALDGEEDTE